MLKSYWVGWWVVAHVIIVSAQSKELGFWVFSTWSDLRVRIWGLLGQGIGDLDSGLTIIIIIIIIILFWDLGTLYFPVLIFPFPYLFPILVPSPSRLTIAGMGPGSKIFFNFCDFFLDGPTLGHISGHM